jgi:hypothetical protein
MVEGVDETVVFYTIATTNLAGSINDCDEIVNADFNECADYPWVPCWPPTIKTVRASTIFRYDPNSPPMMHSSVCIGAITKVRDMGVGTGTPSSSVATMRYIVM